MPEAVNEQSPTPSQGGKGSDLRSVANDIEGLLDDDGQYNPNPDQVSRGHPDYDESTDERAGGARNRDEQGRFKKQEASNEESAEDTATGSDDTDSEVDDTEADTGDTGDTEEVDSTSADDEAETSEADTDSIETLEQLADALEVPMDELQTQLTHTFKAADEEVTVTLAELVRGYQKDADYRRSTAKLAEDRRRAETEFSERMRQYEQNSQALAQTFNTAEQIIIGDANSEQLARLRESDPAEWTARREELGQRLNALRNTRNQAAAFYEQYQAEYLSKLKETEMKALTEAIPDWSDESVKTARNVMQSMGYTEQEIGNIYDHRAITAAMELHALRNEVATLRDKQKKAADTVKRVKKDVPKLQKPGKQRSKGIKAKRGNLENLRSRARKTGKVEDAAKVIENLI